VRAGDYEPGGQEFELCGELLCEVFRKGGARPNMELTLLRGLIEGGFEAPQLRVEIPMASDVEGRRWIYDLLLTMRPRFNELNIASDAVGDFGTLASG